MAKRTAGAAEEEAALTREQVEAWREDRGLRAVVEGIATVRDGMRVIQHESIAETDAADLGRGEEPGRYWNAVLGPLDPGNSYVIDHLVLVTPEPETPVLLSINHPDKPDV